MHACFGNGPWTIQRQSRTLASCLTGCRATRGFGVCQAIRRVALAQEFRLARRLISSCISTRRRSNPTKATGRSAIALDLSRHLRTGENRLAARTQPRATSPVVKGGVLLQGQDRMASRKLIGSALRSTILGRKNDPRRIYDWGLRIRAIFPMMLRQFAFHRLLLVGRLRTQERKRRDVSRYCVAPWGCGGTGRRAGFRIQCPWTCRFDSCHPHLVANKGLTAMAVSPFS